VLGPDGLPRFEEQAPLGLRPHRKAALARLLRKTEAGILFNEHITQERCRFRAGLAAWRRRHGAQPGLAVERERTEKGG
jgi:hypothetical protein